MTDATTAAPTGTTTAAPTTTTTEAPAATTAATTTEAPTGFDWAKTGLDADGLGYVTTKGFKDPAAVIGSYRNLEKLHGVPAEQLLKLPGADAKPEDWAPIYDKLGRPKSAGDYSLPLPEGDKGEFAQTASGWFHEHGLNVKQAQGLAGKWNEFVAAQTKVQTDQLAARDAQQASSLQTKWGNNYGPNAALVDKAAVEFGATKEDLQALRQVMGPERAMEFMFNIGSKLGVEKPMIGDDGRPAGFTAMSPATAQARITELQNDKAFGRRYANGDSEARAEMTRLNKMAYPGDLTIGR